MGKGWSSECKVKLKYKQDSCSKLFNQREKERGIARTTHKNQTCFHRQKDPITHTWVRKKWPAEGKELRVQRMRDLVVFDSAKSHPNSLTLLMIYNPYQANSTPRKCDSRILCSSNQVNGLIYFLADLNLELWIIAAVTLLWGCIVGMKLLHKEVHCQLETDLTFW